MGLTAIAIGIKTTIRHISCRRAHFNTLIIYDRKKGFKASFFKGNYQKKLPNSKLRPFNAEPIQNPKSGDDNRQNIQEEY
jgi:hypothetical protein